MTGLATARMRLTMVFRSTVSGVSWGVWLTAPFAFGNFAVETRSKRMRIGTPTASPKAIASPLPMDERKLVVEVEAFGTADRMIFWSISFVSRMAKTVEHCDRMVWSSSLGRWLMTPSEIPYLRPSLAICAIACRVGKNPRSGSAGT
ncbi:hypothetical protein D3C87_1717530 [compost metagenome]